jgi:hypothetical protein
MSQMRPPAYETPEASCPKEQGTYQAKLTAVSSKSLDIGIKSLQIVTSRTSDVYYRRRLVVLSLCRRLQVRSVQMAAFPSCYSRAIRRLLNFFSHSLRHTLVED